jgi:hypothetical protein
MNWPQFTNDFIPEILDAANATAVTGILHYYYYYYYYYYAPVSSKVLVCVLGRSLYS